MRTDSDALINASVVGPKALISGTFSGSCPFCSCLTSTLNRQEESTLLQPSLELVPKAPEHLDMFGRAE